MINSKEQTVLESIKDACEGENMQTQFRVLGYKIDLYFYECKLAIKVMNYVIMIEILTMKYKDKKQSKKTLIVRLLQLILMKKILTFLKP